MPTKSSLQATASTSGKSRWNHIWIFLIGLLSFLVIECLAATLGYLAEGFFTKKWDHYGGALGCLPVGFAIWVSLQIYFKLKRVFSDLNLQKKNLETLLHHATTSMDRLSEQALAPLLVSSMVNHSPFTGALGSLYARSNGRSSIQKIPKSGYLELLMEAIATTRNSYFTIQPPYSTVSGLTWFEDSAEFLESFTLRESKFYLLRILVMPDEGSIELEKNDQGLVERYWQKVGAETDTYWITYEDLVSFEERYRRRQDDGASAKFTGVWEDTASNIKKSDIVVCDNRLCFRFEEGARSKPQLAFFHDADGDLHPYQWVLEALDSDLSAKQSNRNHVCRFVEVPKYAYTPSPLGPKYSKGIAIDLGQIEENTRLIQDIAIKVPIMAVLKGDAYGLGCKEISKTLMTCDTPVQKFGVSTTLEARDIKEVARREGRSNVEIFLMEGVLEKDIAFTVKERLTPFVWDFLKIQQINKQAERHGIKAHVHIKINTGMNRLGVKASQFNALLERVVEFDNVQVSGIASHLAFG